MVLDTLEDGCARDTVWTIAAGHVAFLISKRTGHQDLLEVVLVQREQVARILEED